MARGQVPEPGYAPAGCWNLELIHGSGTSTVILDVGIPRGVLPAVPNIYLSSTLEETLKNHVAQSHQEAEIKYNIPKGSLF